MGYGHGKIHHNPKPSGTENIFDCIGRGLQAAKSMVDGNHEILSKQDLEEQNMELGAFSVSLAVEDLEASRVFYEKFGFEVVGGEASQNWLILRERQLHHRYLPGDVREEHTNLQSGLGWRSSTARHLYRRA